jgi:hypothetical protein
MEEQQLVQTYYSFICLLNYCEEELASSCRGRFTPPKLLCLYSRRVSFRATRKV